jgi:hypothetical protein
MIMAIKIKFIITAIKIIFIITTTITFKLVIITKIIIITTTITFIMTNYILDTEFKVIIFTKEEFNSKYAK